MEECTILHFDLFFLITRVFQVIHDVAPKENFGGKKPDLSHLKVFGCIAYVHIPDELQTKLGPKAKKCVFIGLFP